MKKPPLSMETVGLYSSRVRFGDAVLISGDLGLASALALGLALPNVGCSMLSTVTTGATGVEREPPFLRSICILFVPLDGAGAVDPWSDDVVIGVTDSIPVEELASKESLSLAMA